MRTCFSLRSTPPLSFALSIGVSGRVLAGLPLSSPLPKEPSAFWSRFGFSAPPFLQRSVLRPVEKSLFSDLKDRLSSSPVSSSSFSACLTPPLVLGFSLFPLLLSFCLIASSALRLGFVWVFLHPIRYLVFVVVLLVWLKILDILCPVHC